MGLGCREKSKLPHDITSLLCTGHNLRGCPSGEMAVWKTKSEKTWKGGKCWVFVCNQCAQKLIE